MPFIAENILDMESLSVGDIELILQTAQNMKEISERPIKKVPALRGKTVVLFFYEPSTRTKLSFDIAAKRLSADSISIASSSSSIAKGETLIDTALNIEAMRPDVLVMRHSSSGAPHLLAENLNIPIVNAGDGWHAHPTQALLDMMTVEEKKGKLQGLTISIIGDISHSRVARSNIAGFTKMGAKVLIAGPPTMIPKGIEKLGAQVSYHIEDVIPQSDVIMMLRIQKERQGGFLFPSEREYARIYGLSKNKLKNAKKDVIIMHPGPVNQGVEIEPSIMDGPHTVILEQVTNGVAVRMAILYLIVQGGHDEN